jgi:hypothetical protein
MAVTLSALVAAGCGGGGADSSALVPTSTPTTSDQLYVSRAITPTATYDVERISQTSSGVAILTASAVNLAIASSPNYPGSVFLDVRLADGSESVKTVKASDGTVMGQFSVPQHLGPVHVSIGPKGDIIIPGAAAGTISTYDIQTGAAQRQIAGLRVPTAAAEDASGTLYVADTIRRLTTMRSCTHIPALSQRQPRPLRCQM